MQVFELYDGKVLTLRLQTRRKNEGELLTAILSVLMEWCLHYKNKANGPTIYTPSLHARTYCSITRIKTRETFVKSRVIVS